MNYDIRRICNYFPEVHSRYFSDTNGVVYTSLARKTDRISIEGKRIRIISFVRENIGKLNTTNKQLMLIPDTKKYYLMHDGTILQRLNTDLMLPNGCLSRKDNFVVRVTLIRPDGNDRGNKYFVHRLVAGCFISSVIGKHVHHKDNDRSNNKLSNLGVFSKEEHLLIHKQSCQQTIPYGSTLEINTSGSARHLEQVKI